MKIVLLILTLATFAWMFYARTHKAESVEKETPNAAVRYTQALQNDVKKAQAVEQKAQAAIDRTSQETQKAVSEGEPQ